LTSCGGPNQVGVSDTTPGERVVLRENITREDVRAISIAGNGRAKFWYQASEADRKV
jgi:hypothetical protein